jgi:hypothetical protein
MFLLRIDQCRSGNILDPGSRVTAHYLGTEIDGIWWKRYKGNGYLMRDWGSAGSSTGVLQIHRFLTRHPLCFPLKDLLEIKTGSSWHAGKWVGKARVVKLLWEKDDQLLVSGFLFSPRPGRLGVGSSGPAKPCRRGKKGRFRRDSLRGQGVFPLFWKISPIICRIFAVTTSAVTGLVRYPSAPASRAFASLPRPIPW